MAIQINFEPPSWPGGPPICPHANLPAFDGYTMLAAYIKRNASVLSRSWTCTQCGHLHADFKVPSPSGDSNGGGRVSRLPDGFKPFWRGRKAEVKEPELPKVERPVKVVLPKEETNQKGLF